MTRPHQSLTEKEKETLRLLLQGYEAKSMAQHLGLSVHTINERLRDARRKLGTSSSREAARLLREAEAQAPELLGDTPLGDAAPRFAAQIPLQPVQGRGKRRRTRWIIGGTIMSATLALLALSALSGSGQVPALPLTTATATAVSATPASEQAAIVAAQQFLALADRDDWAASWEATHKSFQLLNTAQSWAETSKKVRSEAGTIQSRELTTVDFRPAPPNGYWVITFKAKYSKQGDVIETVQLASENGGWRVASMAVD
jgi:DNA-binding CsgD family transcriptional regulator